MFSEQISNDKYPWANVQNLQNPGLKKFKFLNLQDAYKD